MLALFRNNQSTTSLLLALYIGLLHLPALLGWVQPPEGPVEGAGVLYALVFDWILQNPNPNPFYAALASAVLVFLQALSVNKLADEFRLLRERSWLPGVLYALAASCLADFWFLSPPLVAATFVPLALRRTFKVYKQPLATALIFDVGFWTAAAALFYPPAGWILVALYAGINSLRSFKGREQLVLLSGMFTPMFLAWVGCFWFDRGGEFWPVQFGQLFGWFSFQADFDFRTELKWGLLALLLLIVLLSYGIYYHKKLIQAQKYVSILYWLSFAVGASVMLRSGLRAEHFLPAMPVIGIFLAMSVEALRRPMFAEFFHLTLLAGIFLIQFFPFP